MRLNLNFQFNKDDGTIHEKDHAYCFDLPESLKDVSLAKNHILTGSFGERVLCPIALLRGANLMPYTGSLILRDENGDFLVRAIVVSGVVVLFTASMPSERVPVEETPAEDVKEEEDARWKDLKAFADKQHAPPISYDDNGDPVIGRPPPSAQSEFRVLCRTNAASIQEALPVMNKHLEGKGEPYRFYYDAKGLGIRSV